MLAPVGLFSALTGLWMALYHPWSAGDGLAVYWERLFVGTAMTIAVALGIVMGAGRGINIVVAEWIIRRARRGQPWAARYTATSATAAGSA